MVLFFLILLLLYILSIFIIINSEFKICIDKLIIDSKSNIINYEIKFGIFFLDKIRIIGIKINKRKVQKYINTIKNLENSKILGKISKINIKKMSFNLEKKLKNQIRRGTINPFIILRIIIRNLKIDILEFKINLKLGTEDAFLTSMFIAFISILISNILNSKIKKFNENYYYIISPIYTGENIFKLNLNCIINLKLVHIINIIYMIFKKERSDKYVRTSNRRPYGYCHE